MRMKNCHQSCPNSIRVTDQSWDLSYCSILVVVALEMHSCNTCPRRWFSWPQFDLLSCSESQAGSQGAFWSLCVYPLDSDGVFWHFQLWQAGSQGARSPTLTNDGPNGHALTRLRDRPHWPLGVYQLPSSFTSTTHVSLSSFSFLLKDKQLQARFSFADPFGSSRTRSSCTSSWTLCRARGHERSTICGVQR